MQANSPSDIAAVLAEIGIFEWFKAAVDGSAGAATAELVIGTIGPGPANIPLTSVQFAPAALLTADPTNNATITVNKRTAALPGTAVPIAIGVTAASGANNTSSWTAWKAVPLTVQSGAGSFVSPGDVITIAITKGSAGVAVPQGQLIGFTSPN